MHRVSLYGCVHTYGVDTNRTKLGPTALSILIIMFLCVSPAELPPREALGGGGVCEGSEKQPTFPLRSLIVAQISPALRFSSNGDFVRARVPLSLSLFLTSCRFGHPRGLVGCEMHSASVGDHPSLSLGFRARHDVSVCGGDGRDGAGQAGLALCHAAGS